MGGRAPACVDQTDVMLVYWTRFASSSKWVKNEYTYAITHYPDRPLIPIKGDETPMTEPLEARQGLTFVPVINELLDLKRKMEADGRKKARSRPRSETGWKRRVSDWEVGRDSGVSILGITGWRGCLPHSRCSMGLAFPLPSDGAASRRPRLS